MPHKLRKWKGSEERKNKGDTIKTSNSRQETVESILSILTPTLPTNTGNLTTQ